MSQIKEEILHEVNGLPDRKYSQLPTTTVVGLPFHLPDRLGSGRSAIGWLTSALDAMFFAALISALSVYPHLIQKKSDWVFRFSLLVYPQ